MIDHVYVPVADIEKSLAFYAEALKPIGWSLSGNYDAASGPEGVPDLYGLGDRAPTARDLVQASGSVSGSLARPASTWASPVTATKLWMLRTRPPSKQAAPSKVGPPTGPTSRPATTPPTSPTLTATAWSSCTRLGTRRASHPVALRIAHLDPQARRAERLTALPVARSTIATESAVSRIARCSRTMASGVGRPPSRTGHASAH